jgi:hypothetical protein
MSKPVSAVRIHSPWGRRTSALLLAGTLGACSSSHDGAAFSVSPSPSGVGGATGVGGAIGAGGATGVGGATGTGGAAGAGGMGGAGGTTLPFDLDASGIADAAPHVINGTSLGCTCKLIMNFTTIETGDRQAVELNGATLRVIDGATDAAADVPIAVASNAALGGMHVISLDEPTKSAIVVPPAGFFCVVVEYIPTATSVPTVRVGYGGSREFVAGPAGSGAQYVLAPTPGYVNMVGLRASPAIDSVRISPGPAGGVEVPAICFGTDPPPM